MFQDSQQATTPAVDFHTKYFTISLTRLTAVAVVTRLITNILEVPPSGCEIRLSVCPSITIRFPEGAVDTLIKGELQVDVKIFVLDILIFLIIVYLLVCCFLTSLLIICLSVCFPVPAAHVHFSYLSITNSFTFQFLLMFVCLAVFFS